MGQSSSLYLLGLLVVVAGRVVVLRVRLVVRGANVVVVVGAGTLASDSRKLASLLSSYPRTELTCSSLFLCLIH